MASKSGSKWTGDDCEKRFVYPLDRERAEGIIKIHARCEPPCPRKETAAKYLRNVPQSLASYMRDRDSKAGE